MLPPPVAPRRPHVVSAHGDERQDPWFWLRDRDDPQVVAYLEAENAYTDAQAARLTPLRDALFEEMKARIKETDMSVPARRGPWWYYSRTEEGRAYAIHCRRPARELDELPPAGEPGGEEQVLLDENRLAEATPYFAVGTAVVSHDHRWLAYSTDESGSEKYALRFEPLEAEIPPTAAPETVPDVGYGLAWSAGSDHVFYVRLDEAQRPFQLWRHRLGTPAGDDAVVFEEPDRRFSLGTGSSRDGAYVLVGLHSTNTTEWRALAADDPLATPEVVMARREGVEYSVDHLPQGWFVVATNERARDFRIVAAPDRALGRSDPGVWREIVPHRPGVRLEDVDAFRGALVLSERFEAQTRVRVLPLAPPTHPGGADTGGDATGADDPFGDDLLGRSWTVPAVDDPSCTWLGANPESDLRALRIGRASMITPSSVTDVALSSGDETLLKQEPVLGGFDSDDYVTSRIWATAPDGVRVPVSLVHRRDLALPAPTVLYGYGAYEISIDPIFSHHRLSLLDRGAVYAIAHVRGGGEMGRAWYEDGRMEHKANTFSDFVACARHLLASGVARPGALAGRGGSAGGLLIGAVANLAPELFAALVAEVPFVDCVTTMLDDTLPLTVGEWEEWGNPVTDEDAYRRMLSYSPYDNVSGVDADGRALRYPDILVTAGLNDPRVAYWEPAKWVAKVRALSPSTRVLLRTEMGAGHAGPSGRYDAWREEALVLAFLLDALGLGALGLGALGLGALGLGGG
jgi:oligopeptidase B